MNFVLVLRLIYQAIAIDHGGLAIIAKQKTDLWGSTLCQKDSQDESALRRSAERRDESSVIAVNQVCVVLDRRFSLFLSLRVAMRVLRSSNV